MGIFDKSNFIVLFPDNSLTVSKFSDISRFSRQVVTLQITWVS